MFLFHLYYIAMHSLLLFGSVDQSSLQVEIHIWRPHKLAQVKMSIFDKSESARMLQLIQCHCENTCC